MALEERDGVEERRSHLVTGKRKRKKEMEGGKLEEEDKNKWKKKITREM